MGLSLGAGPAVAAILAQDPSPPRSTEPVKVASGADRHEKPCNLGDQSTIDRKVCSADTGGQLFVIENHAQTQFGPPRHVHHNQDEWFHVLSGEVEIEVGEQRYRLMPGDSLLAPRGLPHAWAQIAPEGGRLLIAFQPAGKMEAFFAELARLGRIPPTAEAHTLFEQHGMTVVGPPLKLQPTPRIN
jgi:quercetin dioxygenase-like cupin family protein